MTGVIRRDCRTRREECCHQSENRRRRAGAKAPADRTGEQEARKLEPTMICRRKQGRKQDARVRQKRCVDKSARLMAMEMALRIRGTKQTFFVFSKRRRGYLVEP